MRERIVRHEGSEGRWELLVREPAAPLRPDVLLLEDFEERMASPVRQWHPPATIVPLILNFGPKYRVLDPARPAAAADHDSFTSGLGEAAAMTESPGTALCVQVNLTPLGARRFLGVPLREVAGRVVALDDVLGRPVRELEEQLAETPDRSARLDVAEAFVAARLAAAPPARPDVSYAWCRLVETGGQARVAELTAELGCSRKHLNAQFLEHIGLGPKAAARLIRFDRALALLREGVDAAAVAADCGYADQPHFTREFRRFAGLTPGALARSEQVPFVQDAAEQAA